MRTFPFGASRDAAAANLLKSARVSAYGQEGQRASFIHFLGFCDLMGICYGDEVTGLSTHRVLAPLKDSAKDY